ncbi:MAG: hypothetical protein MI866_05235, partial [Bacteroidales bacterium]|nr:hypothetical protein [Bacteroidales bacterium]
MASNNKRPNQRSGILLTVSMFIILAMGVYYIYTHSVKENRVKRQVFKTLYRYASDLQDKKESLDTKADQLDKKMKTLIAYIIITDNMAIKDSLKSKLESVYEQLPDKRKNETNNDYSSKANNVKVNNTNANNAKANNTKANNAEVNNTNANNAEANNAKANNAEANNTKANNAEAKKDTSQNSLFKDYSRDLLFNDILKEDLFSGFIVFNDSGLFYTEFFNSNPDLYGICDKLIFKTDTLKFHLNDNDKESELILGHEFHSKLQLAGQTYQAFVINTKQDNINYLVGLMPQSKYNSLKRGVDRAFISTLTVLVILLLMSIPIIRLFVIRPGEEYKISHLVTLVISTVGLVFTILYFVLFQSNHKYIKD